MYFIFAHYQILMIVVFTFTGSIVRDIFNTLLDKDNHVEINRIILSAITSSILMYSLTDNLLAMSAITNKTLVSIYFISGLIGFDILGKLTSVEGVVKFLDYIRDYFIKNDGKK